MLDDFREWLSDNLRYFMLGGAILLVLLVLIFGIRACVGRKNSRNGGGTQVTQQDEQDDNTPDEPEADVNEGQEPGTNNPDNTPVSENPLETNEEVTSLITQYYEALGSGDIQTLQTLVDGFSPSDESRVTNVSDYIERYEVKDVYTKQGIGDNTYVVYASYEYLCSGIDTPVPALTQFYVTRNGEGNLKIDGDADEDPRIVAYTSNLMSDSDVARLTAEIKNKYEQAQIDDPALAAFLSGLGEDASTTVPVQEGTTMIANANCNVRAGAGSDEIIGGVPEGAEVVVKGREGDWILIDYEGEDGYIYADLLD